MKNLFFLAILFIIYSCTPQVKTDNTNANQGEFSFAFLTDIHLNNKSDVSFNGLNKAIETAKSNGVDFILTGGDNVDIDVLGNDFLTAHTLMKRYADTIANLGIDYYPTIGNHDRFWGVEKDNPLYNEGLFEHYIHKSYYSFNHNGWHFIVLNTAQICEGSYCVGEEQMAWLEKDIAKLDAKTPIVVSAHVPFLSLYYPALEGRYTDKDTFKNFKQVWDLFEGKNLKLVLQGHQHLYEEINVLGTQFITGGAVSAKWWGGAYHGTEEGFVKISVSGDEFDWEYMDYGWETGKTAQK